MNLKTTFFLSFIVISSLISNGQNTRITDRNSIGWYAITGIARLHKNIGIQSEYHFRRDQLGAQWQQGLFKIAINYQVHQKVQFRLGYGLAETFAYGDIPVNSFGKQFTEHRIFEAISFNDNIGIAGLSHRFMLEQRWIGKYSKKELEKEDSYSYMNRLRYMLRVQVPLNHKKIEARTVYLAGFNELMLGFGKNVQENIFDQNRMGLLAGYNANKYVRIEGGYMMQILQLGREMNGSNVFQYNQGIMLNAVVNVDFSGNRVIEKQ